jgi:transposase-like protein
MTHRPDINAKHAKSAFDGMDDTLDLLQTAENPFAAMLSFLMNRAKMYQRTKRVCAGKHERNDYANGFKDRSFKTRLGKLVLKVPQVRDSDEPFYPNSPNAAMMSETALRAALAVLYLQGVATRRVKDVL